MASCRMVLHSPVWDSILNLAELAEPQLRLVKWTPSRFTMGGRGVVLPASTDGFRGWRVEASLGAIRRRFETALMIAAGYSLGGMLTTRKLQLRQRW